MCKRDHALSILQKALKEKLWVTGSPLVHATHSSSLGMTGASAARSLANSFGISYTSAAGQTAQKALEQLLVTVAMSPSAQAGRTVCCELLTVSLGTEAATTEER